MKNKTREQLTRELTRLRKQIAELKKPKTEHKQIEEELQTTKKQIEFVLGVTKTGLDIIDSKFNIKYIDAEWQKIYGNPKGKKCYKYFMGRNNVCPNCAIPKAIKTKKPIVTEEVLVKENHRPIRVITIPFKDKNGKWLVAEVNVDITEQKQSEEALRVSEKKIRAVFDQTFQFIGMMTVDGTLIEANKTAMHFAGINESDCLGKPFWDTPWWTHSKELQNKLREAVTRAASGETVLFEATHLAADRSVHYIDFSLKPIKDQDGKVIFLIPEGRDITERKQADEELKKHREHLEELVRKRTDELETVNKIIRQDTVACNIMSEELRKSEKRYRELWDDAPVAYHILDTKGIITNVNKTEAKMLGYNPQEMIGKSIFDFILPEQRAEAQKRFQQKLSGKHLLKAESRIYTKKDGSKIYVLIDDVLEYDSYKKVIGMKTTMVDFTESKKMEEALRESEVQYRTTINSIVDPIHVVDADLRVILFNNAFKKLLQDIGLKTESITGQILFDVLPFLSDKTRNEYKGIFESGEDLITEEQVNIGGRGFIAEIRKIPIWEDTKVVRILTFIRDITERRKAEETIRHLAYYDALTNLPNRTLFNNRLALELSRAQRNQQKASVMLLDLDKFKDVNDKLGHTFGDQLLQSVGRRLADTIRLSDTVARMGGDEFVLLLPEIIDAKDAVKIAEKTLDTMRKPFIISDHKLHVTTSIGISIYPSHGEDAETLIKNADIAMYKAKESGRDRYFLYGANSSLLIPF